jgi:putative DNA primase/helicase
MPNISTIDHAVNDLADLAEMPRWVAWREEQRERTDGTRYQTKIPYDPNSNGPAKIPSDPATWGTRALAERRWRRFRLDAGQLSGVGIVLGDLGNGFCLMGLDLDRCIIPNNGDGIDIDPFTNTILARFNSYAEVSPSRLGIKVFFLIRADHQDEVVERLLESKKRKAFTASEHHEIAIDWARYYAVTGLVLDDHPSFRVVDVADIRWFVEQAGPQFLREHRPADTATTRVRTRGLTARPSGRDESGSGYGFRFLATLKGAGASFEEACRNIREDRTAAGEWARRVDDRQLQRAWDRARMLNREAPLECAREFVQSCGEVALVYHRGGFYQWLGSHYNDCDEDLLRRKLYEFLDHCFTLNSKGIIVPFNPTAHRVNQIVDALKANIGESSQREIPFWLDDDANRPEASNLIACRNGLLDLSTRELHPHSAQFFNVNCLPFDYNPNAPNYPKKWLRFLKQLWPGREGQAERYCLQEMFGLSLTNITEQQKMFMLLGPKRSGKGTIGRVLTALLGEDNVVSPTLSSLNSEFGLWPLIGKRVAIITDARLGDKTNVQAVVERLLTLSGEDALTINRKYRSHWTGRLNVRVWVFSNELPKVPDSSRALASRFILLVLRISFFGREDIKLTEKLLTELPGILNWSLVGLQRLLQRGYFEMPENSQQAIRQFEDLTSPVGAFVRDWCKVGPQHEVRVKHLFKVWKLWCEQEGDKPGSNIVFGRNLRAVLPQVRTQGKGHQRTYIGLTLNANVEEV